VLAKRHFEWRLDFFADFATEAEFLTSIAEVYEKPLQPFLTRCLSNNQSENGKYDYAMVKLFIEVYIV
jgi:hypothetical protein